MRNYRDMRGAEPGPASTRRRADRRPAKDSGSIFAAVVSAHRGTTRTVPTSVGFTIEIVVPLTAGLIPMLEVAAE